MSARGATAASERRFLDEKLASGHVRAEARLIADAVRDHGEHPLYHVVGDAIDAAGRSIHEGRGQIEPRAIRDHLGAICAKARADARTIAIEEIDATQGKPKKARGEARIVYLHQSEDGTLGLSSANVEMTTSHLDVSMRTRGVIYTPHLCERLLQRGGGEDRGRTIRAIGEGLYANRTLIALLAQPALAWPRARIALPFGDGLILARVTAEPLVGSRVYVDRYTSKRGYGFELPPFLVERGAGTAKALGILASTWIGPEQMGPIQRAMHGTLLGILAFYEGNACVQIHGHAAIWPLFSGYGRGTHESQARAALRAEFEAAQDAVAGILSHPDLLRACGNTD